MTATATNKKYENANGNSNNNPPEKECVNSNSNPEENTPETAITHPEQDTQEDTDTELCQEEERKILFLKAAQGYGMIFGFGGGYILSGILSELGLQAGKFECVILCMFAGIAIGTLLSNKKS
ncbi:MAG: hypothetical protein Q4B85_00875 [Lachnospiraceae bacterium]|nr:hypothetical protein [Lachnospiraceae bacterium]